MPRPSTSGKFVRISADEVPVRTPRDMARLKAAMDIPVEPSEGLESSQLAGPGVRRDASGKILKRPLGLLRTAILAALDRHEMTRYELWKKAHARCESLSASAVYEYLRGDREIGSEYLEALIEAARLKIINQGGSRAKKSTAVPQIEETLKRTFKATPPVPPTPRAASQTPKTTKKPAGLKGPRSPKSVKVGKP